MTKKSRRDFLYDAGRLLLIPAAASIVPATLEDILDINDARAQSPSGEIHEHHAFTIGLQNYETHSILGRIDQTNVGSAVLHTSHTPSTYHTRITSTIDVHGSWVRMQANLHGTYAHTGRQPRFRPRYYWLRYREGGNGTTPKTFLTDIHFDFSTRTARSYGYHEQRGQPTQRYGLANARIESQFHPSTRDLISAMMEARFLPTQDRRQINTIVEGQPRALWLEHVGYGVFRPSETVGYPTRRFRLHFPEGILPDTSWDLYFHFHDAQDRTPLRATLRKSDGSQIIFTLRDPASSISGASPYAAP